MFLLVLYSGLIWCYVDLVVLLGVLVFCWCDICGLLLGCLLWLFVVYFGLML